MTDVRLSHVVRGMFAVLALTTAATGCAVKANQTADELAAPAQTRENAQVYLDAPLQISSRWWLSRQVAETPESDDPTERAAAEVLQIFFGSDSADAMVSVSTGAARVFAEFMSVMEAVSGRHPMEEVIMQQVPRVAEGRSTPDVLVEGVITEDRSTGAGTANRTTFDQFVMILNSGAQPKLVDFQRDGTWISELVAPGDSVEPVGTDSGTAHVVAILRSALGRYMVAGTIDGAVAGRWSLREARLESNAGGQAASLTFSEVGVAGAGGSTPFLITFDDQGLSRHGARLILPSIGTMSQGDLVFQMPSLGTSRDGEDVSSG